MTSQPDTESPVMAYKAMLRRCIDRRPSGLRRKLAGALGKHKSFVSQITSTSYSVPIPAGDLPVIFEVCHLSPEEQQHFLSLYEQAHPGRTQGLWASPPDSEVRVTIPAFRSARLGREVEEAIRDAAERIIRVARAADGDAGERGGDFEEVSQ